MSRLLTKQNERSPQECGNTYMPARTGCHNADMTMDALPNTPHLQAGQSTDNDRAHGSLRRRGSKQNKYRWRAEHIPPANCKDTMFVLKVKFST